MFLKFRGKRLPNDETMVIGYGGFGNTPKDVTVGNSLVKPFPADDAYDVISKIESIFKDQDFIGVEKIVLDIPNSLTGPLHDVLDYADQDPERFEIYIDDSEDEPEAKTGGKVIGYGPDGKKIDRTPPKAQVGGSSRGIASTGMVTVQASSDGQRLVQGLISQNKLSRDTKVQGNKITFRKDDYSKMMSVLGNAKFQQLFNKVGSVAEAPVNELSKDTLRSYSKAAGREVGDDQRDAKSARDKAIHHISHGELKKGSDWSDEADWLNKRAGKRAGGIARATTKIAQKGMEEGDEQDHEISMASSELQSITKDAAQLLDMVRQKSEEEGLEAWQQSKITKAADFMNSVLQSLSGDEEGVAERADWGGPLYDPDLQKGKKKPKLSDIKVKFPPKPLPKNPVPKEQGVAEGYGSFQGKLDREKADFKRRELDAELGDEGGRNYRTSSPPPKGMYFYNVRPGEERTAQMVGLKQTKNGKWYSKYPNPEAGGKFGPGKYWEPKSEGVAEDDGTPGYIKYEQMKDKIASVLIKLYDQGNDEETIKQMSSRVARHLGYNPEDPIYQDAWMSSFTDASLDGSLDREPEDDYTDYTMRQGEMGRKGMGEGLPTGSEFDKRRKLIKYIARRKGWNASDLEHATTSELVQLYKECQTDRKDWNNRRADWWNRSDALAKEKGINKLDALQQTPHDLDRDTAQGQLKFREKNVAESPNIDQRETNKKWRDEARTASKQGHKWTPTNLPRLKNEKEKSVGEGLKDPKDNPCWKGYKPVGTKKKNGKTVPNCVPTNEDNYFNHLSSTLESKLKK
jgi:hypothetical protein